MQDAKLQNRLGNKRLRDIHALHWTRFVLYVTICLHDAFTWSVLDVIISVQIYSEVSQAVVCRSVY
jgi:hypothetical protein